MGKYFGTDGFRGEANVTLTAGHAFRVGRFLGWYCNQERGTAGPARIVIGKDTRRSGYLLEHALISGLVSAGADAWRLHVTTTPSVAYLVRTGGFDCGVMISASHNPYYDNGIKLINAVGEKMEESVIALVEEYLDSRDPHVIPPAVRDRIGRTVDYAEGRSHYIQHLISLGRYSLQGLKVGLDCANGSAWRIAGAVFDALGAQTHVINAQPDGCNINENAGSTHMENLQKYVVENGLDVGFAYDGDADRCLCVDEQGNVITGDHILYICGRYMKEQGKLPGNTVTTTVMSNLGLYKALDAMGIQYARTPVGDKYVYEHMRRTGASLGGEQSGHIIFSGDASTGDGILTSLKVTEVMMAKRLPLSRLCEDLTIYPQVLKNIRVTDQAAALEDPAVRAAIAAAGSYLGDAGRILVRPSGTEPLVRVMAEAGSREQCLACVDSVAEAIVAGGYAV